MHARRSVARHRPECRVGHHLRNGSGSGAGPAKPSATPRTAGTAADLPAQVFAGSLAAGAQAGAPDPAEALKQERLQKIRQLTFDRRPAAILKAWSTPRDEALKQPEPSAATIQNIQTPAAVRRAATAKARGTLAGVISAGQLVSPGAAVAAGPATAPNAKPDGFDQELRGFQYDVTLGDWPAVKRFLAKLPQEEGKAAYEQLIAEPEQHAGYAGQHADANAACKCSRCKCK